MGRNDENIVNETTFDETVKARGTYTSLQKEVRRRLWQTLAAYVKQKFQSIRAYTGTVGIFYQK